MKAETKNIKEIKIWENNPGKYNDTDIVVIEFAHPCEWTTLTIQELLKLLKLWIVAEERRYPLEKGYRGRWLLFDEIKKVFNER